MEEKTIKQIFYPVMEMNLLRISFTQEQAEQFESMTHEEQLSFLWEHLPEKDRKHTPKELFMNYTLSNFELVQGICKQCGCTHFDPCNHPEFGPCWWESEEQNLCSHCANPEIAQDPNRTGAQNVIAAVFPNNNLIKSGANEQESTNVNN